MDTSCSRIECMIPGCRHKIAYDGRQNHVARSHSSGIPARWLCELCGHEDKSWARSGMKTHYEQAHAKPKQFVFKHQWEDSEIIKQFNQTLTEAFPPEKYEPPVKKKDKKKATAPKKATPPKPPSKGEREEELIGLLNAKKFLQKSNAFNSDTFLKKKREFEVDLGVAAKKWGKKPSWFDRLAAADTFRVVSQLLVSLATLATEDPDKEGRDEAWAKLLNAQETIAFAIEKKSYFLWQRHVEKESLLTLDRFARSATEKIKSPCAPTCPNASTPMP